MERYDIEYNGNSYPSFDFEHNGITYTCSVDTLEDAILTDDKGDFKDAAGEELDSHIIFYVTEEEMKMTDEELVDYVVKNTLI